MVTRHKNCMAMELWFDSWQGKRSPEGVHLPSNWMGTSGSFPRCNVARHEAITHSQSSAYFGCGYTWSPCFLYLITYGIFIWHFFILVCTKTIHTLILKQRIVSSWDQYLCWQAGWIDVIFMKCGFTPLQMLSAHLLKMCLLDLHFPDTTVLSDIRHIGPCLFQYVQLQNGHYLGRIH